MCQMQTIGKTATKIEQIGDTVFVKYHSTNVISFSPEQIILNTGGWFTQTTKTRMNQAANQFNLGYYLYQKKHEWFVDFKGETHKFNGNLVILDR